MTLSLFQAFGLELEYMLVDPTHLRVRPISDQVLHALTGEYLTDADLGEVGVSNELTRHVIEIKNEDPVADLGVLPPRFHAGVRRLNEVLAKLGATLLPGGMHPFMDPAREVELWPHEYAEVYREYDRIFDCHTHGFGNIQSVHLNLPFAGEREFVALHRAVRYLLPLLPALAASSPIFSGRVAGVADARLLHYAQNQAMVPAVSGQLIPEPVNSIAEYETNILHPIYAALKQHDPMGILQYEWVNSRGAIARFDRDAIEIRLMDMQECPRMDTALCAAVVSLLRSLVEERWSSSREQGNFPQENLVSLLQSTVKRGGEALIEDRDYLRGLGYEAGVAPRASDLWRHLIENSPPDSHWEPDLKILLTQGNLSARILRRLGTAADSASILREYQALRLCLEKNQAYESPAA